MNDTVIILCAIFFCVLGSAVGPHSGCVVKCMDYSNVQLEGCVQPTLFGGWYVSPEYIHLNRMVVPTICATSSHPHSAPKPTEPIPRCPQQHPKYSTEPSIPFGWVNENACGRELGSVRLQSSSSKRKARHFVLTNLVLDRVADLTPSNEKL